MEDEAKKWSWRHGTIDSVIFNGTGWIKKIIVVPKDTKKTAIFFYDGIDASGNIKLHIQTATANTEDIDFPMALRCERGLFVDVDNDLLAFHVQYREEK